MEGGEYHGKNKNTEPKTNKPFCYQAKVTKEAVSDAVDSQQKEEQAHQEAKAPQYRLVWQLTHPKAASQARHEKGVNDKSRGFSRHGLF